MLKLDININFTYKSSTLRGTWGKCKTNRKFKKLTRSELNYQNSYILHYERRNDYCNTSALCIVLASVLIKVSICMVVYGKDYRSQGTWFDSRLPLKHFFIPNSGFIRQIHEFQPDFLWRISIRGFYVFR